MAEVAQDYGLTLAYEGERPTVDIVFVHGLFGKPRSTWTYKNAQVEPEQTAPSAPNGTDVEPRKASSDSVGNANAATNAGPSSPPDNGKRTKEGRRFWTSLTSNFKPKPAPPTKNVFWPADLLPTRIPDARVFTWGYDADIDHLLTSAGQATIFQHARQLAQDVADVRDTPESQSRKLIFVAHSLGGIVVKDMLVYANSTSTKHLRQILESTHGIIFFGTPHRGSPIATLSKIAHDITKVMGKRPATKTLDDLRIDSETLDRVSTYFKQLLSKHQINIHTFQEELPIYGVMIVPQFSSVFEGYGEETGTIHADHRAMTKFASAKDRGFMRTMAVMVRWMAEIKEVKIEADSQQQTPVANAPFLVPFDRDPDFTGRRDILSSLKTGFKKYPNLALHGLGGIGKSQIAIEYAYQVREENPETTILWAHGADGTRFRDSYKSIATKLKIPGADDENAPFLSLVYAALSDPNTGPWLLILDNVDDLSVFKNPDRDKHGLPNAQQADSVTLQAYLPKSPKGKLLVTSRSKTCLEILTTQSHLCLIAVPPMVSEDCMKLLLSRIPPESAGTEEERHELITELENLPLAISHAAAYIYEKSDFINVPQYLEEFRQSESSRMELLRENIQDLRRDQRPNYSVLRTWDMSFDHIQKNSPLSAKMLFIMSIYSSQNIPDKLLMKSVSENDKLRTVLGPLRQFHLISVHADQTLFDIHRFVQLATRTYLQNIDQLEEYRSIGVKALVASLSDLPVLPPMELRFAYMNYLPHATEVAEHAFAHDDDTNAVSRLLSLMAVLLTNSGDPWKALAASTRATELSIKCSEPDSPERITRLAVHGSCLIESGDPAAGETVLREMLSAVHRQADEDDWKDTAFLAFVFKYRCQLAVAFERQGKWEDSTAEVRKVLELIDSSETRLQDPLYQLRVRLCNSLWQQHRLVEAKDLSEEFLASLQNSTIPNAAYFMFQFLRLLLNIAMQTRRYDRAQKLLERLEPMVDTQFGTKSYNGIMMLHDKAALKVFLNDAVGALGDVERLENITKEIYGDRLPHFILITLSIKGEILEMLGRHTDALTLRERLLRTRTETFGPCHMHTIRARIEVANSLSAMGQIERAMEVVREPIEKLERLPGRVKPETVWSMSHVSGYLLQLGRSTEAFDLGRACVLLSKELPESESELAMRCLFNLGDKLMDVFQYEEASEHLRFALEKTKTLRPEVDPDVCAITSKLVICLENIKETEAAESLLREMEQKTKDVLGPGHDETFLWQQRLGSFLNRQNKFDEAGTIFKEALKQSKIALGPHHFRPVAIQSDLALHYRDCEKPDLAEPLDRETLRLRQEATPIDEYDVFQSMNNLAMTLWHLKKYDEAVTLLNQAIDGRTMRFGGKTKDTDFYRANLLTVRISQEDWTAADTLATSIVAFRTQFFGPHHASTLQTIKKQLRIWENTENWPRMVESYDEIMGLYSAGPGDEDPESMSVRIQLSRAFQETGQHDRVEEILLPIYDCVMDGKVSAFDTSFFCLRLGPALQALQKYVEMESFSRRLILMMAERFPGEGDESPRIMLASALQCQKKHLEAAKVQHKLCLGKEKSGGHKTVYFQTSLRVYLTLVGTSLEIDEDSVANLVQWKEKLIIWSADTAGVRELLVIMARVLRNHDHPDAVEAFRVCLNFEALQGSNQDPLKAMSAKRELQMALNQTEHIREALDLARELQQDWRRHIESNPEVDEPANTRFIIGYNLIAYGEWYEAEVLAQTFYDECLNKRGEDNIVTIEALRLLAAAELACGRYKKAIARYTAALDKQSSDPTTSSVVLAVIRGNLTESHLKNGTYEQARAIVSAPFLPDCEYSGARKRYRLNLLRLESTILQRLREVDRALPLAEDALKEFTSLLGSTADWTIRCVLLLAQICFDRNNMEEAERYVMTAMMRSKKRDVLHNPIIVECQLVLARVYDAQGCLAKAVVMYRQAWMTSTEMFRDDHPTLVGAEREMGVAMAKWCKLYGAKKCEI